MPQFVLPRLRDYADLEPRVPRMATSLRQTRARTGRGASRYSNRGLGFGVGYNDAYGMDGLGADGYGMDEARIPTGARLHQALRLFQAKR